VTVRSFPHTVAANAARIRLEAEGIPTFLSGARMAESVAYQVATGGVKLQVPRALLADARVLLAQSWAPPFADEDLDAWEDGVIASEPVVEHEGGRSWGPLWLALWVLAAGIVLAVFASGVVSW
jgi:hypothetical protein